MTETSEDISQQTGYVVDKALKEASQRTSALHLNKEAKTESVSDDPKIDAELKKRNMDKLQTEFKSGLKRMRLHRSTDFSFRSESPSRLSKVTFQDNDGKSEADQFNGMTSSEIALKK